MFDYIVTGKPMLFLCPDLETYQETVRGFYLDFESIAPGEIVRSRTDAVELLSSSSVFTTLSTERYVDFSRRFASRDDGAAAYRVINQLKPHFD